MTYSCYKASRLSLQQNPQEETLASIIALSALAASAVEVGINTTRDFAGDGRNSVGVTVGQQYGKLGVTAGYERFDSDVNDQDRYSVVGSYDVAKFGPVTVAGKVGGAYLSNQVGENGYALTAGVGASVPVTKAVAFTVDYTRQVGQQRVSQYDGNKISAGLKYSF